MTGVWFRRRIPKVSFFALLSTILVAATTARADVVWLERQLDLGQSIKSTMIRLDTSKNHVWVDVTLQNYIDPGFSGRPCRGTCTLAQEVPGLSYEASTKRVLFAAEAGPVVCANVVFNPGSLFTRPFIIVNPTGRCHVRSYRSSRVVTGDIVVYDFDLTFETDPIQTEERENEDLRLLD